MDAPPAKRLGCGHPEPQKAATMHRLLIALGLAAGLAVAGCAGPGPGLTGNDTGGIIPWSPQAHRDAPAWAAAHCARYGKIAVKTGEVRGYGNYTSFACRWDRRAPRY